MRVTLRECLTNHSSTLDHSLLLKEQQLYRIENDAVEILVKELTEQEQLTIVARSQQLFWSEEYQLMVQGMTDQPACLFVVSGDNGIPAN